MLITAQRCGKCSGVPKLHIKYLGRRVRKALGDAVGLQIIFCGKDETIFSCIFIATNCCRYTLLCRLFQRSLHWLTNAVDGGARRNTLWQSQLYAGAVNDDLEVLVTLPQGDWPVLCGISNRVQTILYYKAHIIASDLHALTEFIKYPGSARHAYRFSHSVYGRQALGYPFFWS